MSKRTTSLLLAALAAVGLGGCIESTDPNHLFPPLVFPAEARVGASAFMVIDSNQISGDEIEQYDLTRENVEIRVEGNLGIAPATLRSVFSLEAGRLTSDALLHANSWMTIAFFDLPDLGSGIFSAPYPQTAELHLWIDGQEVSSMLGFISVIGEGGEPTSMDAMPLLPQLEDELEPMTTVRLRAKGDSLPNPGFMTNYQVGAVQVDVDFDATCLAAPRAHAGSEAGGAGVTVGAQAPSPLTAGRNRVVILLTKQGGFMLPWQTPVDPTRLGSGPILDIVFDRTQTPSCNGPLSAYFNVRSVKVYDRDSKLKITRPSPTEEASFDASQIFHFHYIDPERPS